MASKLCLGSPSGFELGCGLLAAGIALTLCALGRSLPAPEDCTDAMASDKSHVAVYDNAKAFCVVGIVLFHAFGFVLYPDETRRFTPHVQVWSGQLPLIGLCFVSGAVSKGPPTWARFQSLCMNVLLPFFTYSLSIDLLLEKLAGEPVSAHLVLHGLLHAQPRPCWYLQSLVLWRLFAWASHLAAARLGTPVWPWLCALAAFLQALTSFVWIGVFSLHLASAYFPAFAAGLLFPTEELLAHLPHTSAVKAAGVGCVVGWTWLGSFHDFNFAVPIKDLPMKTVGRSGCISGLSWCVGMVSVLVFVVLFLALLVTALPRQEHWFTRVGKATLYVYLLHPPALCLVAWLAPGLRRLPDGAKAVAGLCLALALTVLLSTSAMQFLFFPIIEPRYCLSALKTGRCAKLGTYMQETRAART